MQARINNPAVAVPNAMAALRAVKASVHACDLEPELIELVELRASQINGCSVCVDLHSRNLKKAGESDERIFTVAAWRDAPYFDNAERAVLALTEAVTRLSDQPDPVPDAIWQEAARHFNENQLAGLILAIASINVWNRLNVATRQPAGQAW